MPRCGPTSHRFPAPLRSMLRVGFDFKNLFDRHREEGRGKREEGRGKREKGRGRKKKQVVRPTAASGLDALAKGRIWF